MSERTACQSCSAPAELFICPRCVDEMRAQLVSLVHGPEVNGRRTAGLLDNLADVVLKQTKMGDGSGHRKRGDEYPDPFEPDTEKGRQTAQGRAATLLSAANNALSTIIRDLCESRGIASPRGLLPSRMAEWLAAGMHAIACDESAGEWRAEIDKLVRSIERAIDKPTKRVWLGDCPTWNEHTRTTCGVSLWAPEDAPEVRCHRCRASHDPRRLKLLLFNDLERTKVPWEKILLANKSQPEDRRVPERTLQSWRHGKDGNPPRLTIRGYRRPDGRVVINRHSPEDTPLYLWPDVRRLRDEKPQKKPTGAAARVGSR